MALRGYRLDGLINRELVGKQIERVTKDGVFLVIECVGGEQFKIAWTNPNGEVIKGEPCLVKVDVDILVPGATIGTGVFGG